MTDLLNGLINFGLYFTISIILLLAFKFIYALVTPYDEWKLVKEHKNIAASVGFSGAIIGFSIALASAAANSISLIDFAIWGVIALVAQIIAFAILRFLFMPKLVERIQNDEVSAGIMLGGLSVSVGLLNAACMTY